MEYRIGRRRVVVPDHGARDLEPVTKRRRGHATIRKQGNQSDLMRSHDVVGLVDSTKHRQQRVDRLITATHAFHRQHRTTYSHDEFTASGCGHGSDVRIDEQPMTDDG